MGEVGASRVIGLQRQRLVPGLQRCVLPGRRLGVVYEGAGYATINFTTISLRDVADQLLGK